MSYVIEMTDCLDPVKGMPALDAGSVDVIVTSPPYNLGTQYRRYKDRMRDDAFLHWTLRWVNEARRLMHKGSSFFLNIGSKPSKPLLPYTIAHYLTSEGTFRFDHHEIALPALKLQNVFHWIKSISVTGVDDNTQSFGHFKPINSPRYVNDLHEFIFHFTLTGSVAIDRLALGVPYEDQSNVKRWAHTSGRNLRCRGNTWFIPALPPERNLDQDARWLALLVDTEGSVTVNISNNRKSGRSPAHVAIVSITNTSVPLLEKAVELVGEGDINPVAPTEGAVIKSNKPVFRVVYSSRTAYDLLIRIYPWLIAKKRQARAALYLEGMKQERPDGRKRLDSEELIIRGKLCGVIKELNHGAEPDDSWIDEPGLVDPVSNTLYIPYKTIQSRKDRPHPATFPPELVEQCLKLHGAGRVRLMLDPFVGMGNSITAAQRQGIPAFIGFDIDRFYVEQSRSRL